MKHVVSIKDFKDKKLLDSIFSRALKLKNTRRDNYVTSLHNKVIATVFYEPSTRTRLSFESATLRLGGQIISTENAGQFSSAAKGETLEDSIRTICGYADAIVLRHPEVGSSKQAARVSSVPIINAGDGAGDHPTQALLDMFTITEAEKNITGLKIGLVGDLLYGRTVHSLTHLLSLYKPEVYCIAPKALQLPDHYKKMLEQKGIKVHTVNEWTDIVHDLDVIYMTRIQKERFKRIEEYKKLKGSFILDTKTMKRVKDSAIIMHPLPRVNEISEDIDSDPRAIYFEQARNGLFVRMALLEYIFK